MDIRLKRAYEEPDKDDGFRALVDRVWPRGVSKKDARLDAWLKDVAPSSKLRKWFGHDPEKWEEFKKKYAGELEEGRPEQLDELLKNVRNGRVTLVYGAADKEHNNAVALKAYIEQQSAD